MERKTKVRNTKGKPARKRKHKRKKPKEHKTSINKNLLRTEI